MRSAVDRDEPGCEHASGSAPPAPAPVRAVESLFPLDVWAVLWRPVLWVHIKANRGLSLEICAMWTTHVDMDGPTWPRALNTASTAPLAQ